MKWRNKTFLCGIVLCVAAPFVLFMLAKQTDVNKQPKEEFVQKTQRLQIPFITNEHQMNERVAFFTNTFGGSVFVTRDGELVYSLPGAHEKIKAEEKWSKKLILKESFIGGKVEKIQGEGKTVTNVSYFKGEDPSRWKSNISTYEVVNLGEVYKGIELKLRAYGNNIEKFFYVKPDIDPELIKIKLSGAKALKVNKEGQLEAETELGTVTFTKPVAYQEIHGKRVDVDVSYLISDCGSRNADCEKNQNQGSTFSNSINPKSEIHNPQSVYGFKVASYDRTKELIIDPLLASTYLGGLDSDYGYSIARDADKNIIVAGYTQSSDFPQLQAFMMSLIVTLISLYQSYTQRHK